MGAENVGKQVAWSVRKLDGGQKQVEGTVLAFVPAGASVRAAVPEGTRRGVKKAIVDRSAAARYLVSADRELYVPLAGTVDLALLRDGAKDMSRAELDAALEARSGRP